MEGEVTILKTFFRVFDIITLCNKFQVTKNTSHVRPVLVSEKYPDTKSDLYFSRSGTVFLYYESYFIIICFGLEVLGCIFNICIVPYFWQVFKVDKHNSTKKLNFMHSWWFSAPRPTLILVVFLEVGGVAWHGF